MALTKLSQIEHTLPLSLDDRLANQPLLPTTLPIHLTTVGRIADSVTFSIFRTAHFKGNITSTDICELPIATLISPGFRPTQDNIQEAAALGIQYCQLGQNFTFPLRTHDILDHLNWNFEILVKIQGIVYKKLGLVSELLMRTTPTNPLIVQSNAIPLVEETSPLFEINVRTSLF